MPLEVFIVKLAAMGMVTGLAYGVLSMIGGYLKRPIGSDDQADLLERQTQEIHNLQDRCEELELRLENAERRMLRARYQPVITPSEGT